MTTRQTGREITVDSHSGHNVATPVTQGAAPASPGLAPSAQPKDSQTGHDSHSQPTPAVVAKPEDKLQPENPKTQTHEGHTGTQPAPTPEKRGGVSVASPTDPHRGHSDTPAKAASPSNVQPIGDAHASGHPVRELMVMSDGEMGVRVGRGATNVTPMGQMSSGTSWQPISSPTYMWHKSSGDWLLMFHGEAKVGVNRQGGPKGVTKFESQNWIMPMAFRRVGQGTLQLRGMFSAEPLTFSGAGSPQLFQTGEIYNGQPIRDFQHPHDLVMELSAQYTMALGERGTWYTYVGFPGEPALGPTAFMHRPSSSENPTAPLGHHFQDSTHISFGVLTTGFTYRWLKLEGSLFNGREPDDRRYNFEFNPWNSRSVRITIAPNKAWTMQYSYGFLKNPEFFEPGNTHRQTASVQFNKPFDRGNLATALIWGRNREKHGGETFRLNSYLAEATVNFLDRNYIYSRIESVDREGEDLLTHEELHELGFDDGQHPQFRVQAFTFGAARDIWNSRRWSFAIGGDATFYSKPHVLDSVYGHNPASFKFFLRIRPSRMKGESHAAHN